MQVVIDSCCATFAEVQKRGKDFWAEFELYAADLLVGVVVDIALVGMLAPYARIRKRSISSGFFGRIQHVVGALPSRLIINACWDLETWNSAPYSLCFCALNFLLLLCFFIIFF